MADPNTPGTPGTQQPGTAAPTPGTGGSPETPENQYLTKAEFGRSAAMIRGLGETLATLQTGMLTMDMLAQVGLVDVEEVEGKKQYKPKSAAAAATPKPRAEDDPLVQRLKTVESQLERAKKEKQDADTAVAASQRDTAIIEALRAAGAVNPMRDFTHLQSKVLKGDKGYYAKGTDEAGYDVEVAVNDLAVEFLKANPELKKATGNGGSGTPQNGTGTPGTGVRPGQQVIPKTQWQDMNWFMANRAKFDKGEFLRGQ